MLSDDFIIDTLSAYEIQTTRAQCDQIRAYISLLLKWNRSISLTTVTDEERIIKFHFGESAFALRAVPRIFGRLADVGSGAGFPGIPLRIFSSDIELILIESNAKKCVFLSEVMRTLGLKDAKVIRSRFETAEEQLHGALDMVASRAVGGRSDLVNWAQHVLKPGGRVVLWMGADDLQQIESFSLLQWLQPIKIPGSARRYILVGKRP